MLNQAMIDLDFLLVYLATVHLSFHVLESHTMDLQTQYFRSRGRIKHLVIVNPGSSSACSVFLQDYKSGQFYTGQEQFLDLLLRHTPQRG